MLMMESAMGVRFPAGANFCSFTALPHCRSMWSSDEITGVPVTSLRSFYSGSCDVPWSRLQRLMGGSVLRKGSLLLRKSIRASTEYLGSAPDPAKQNKSQCYHPLEDIVESTSENCRDARLTATETTRTIVEVNNKATVMFTDLINDEIHENVIWSELPYVKDEHGNIYFQVKNDEDILQTLTSENNFVHVIVGFDRINTMEMLQDIELSGLSEIDLGIEEIEDENSDDEDDDDEEEEDEDEDDWVAVLQDEDNEDDSDSDETLGDWAKLETMRYSHPMAFAKTLAQVASDEPIDWMEQPPAGLAIQGIIRPSLLEEHSDIQKHMSGSYSRNPDINQVGGDEKLDDVGAINGEKQESQPLKDGSIWSEESLRDEIPRSGTSFYKLEMIKIQLISEYGHQTVEVEDFRKAQPDAIAHSAAKIISRLKAGGEKITQAFKSLCWRFKGIQVEEAALIGVDSLGFDLRVCSGTQIQTLRFPFSTRAASEYSAERQLNDLLFPTIHHMPLKKKQTHENEV
ncbi:uncharacterized protein At3g49140-like isoform X2 [Tripterygium wilfordii]|uniref:uncharacterized protein At3g49140-like isoform X2 n=1 Tax=Tripterygium wilfordii TaxID=458696 RepID=UPI0018F7F936|nr:uncharacterized protein At3g49140-like isoform X2 [Tripterygium wilfordii]